MRILITGGAGFVGSNLSAHFLARGHDVVVMDDLSRRGTQANLDWLRGLGGRLTTRIEDIRSFDAAREAVSGVDAILHLGAQVAVTTSVRDPRTDFEINALGTFNVLEAARLEGRIPIIFTSTNKVYGKMDQVGVVERGNRYEYDGIPGASEDMPLDFYSPYGCSKGAADQYIRDYGRIYGIPTVVFRMSCIYGPRQMGNEDQGWVAHFLISGARGQPVTIFGDGKQIRDVLFVTDLIRAFETALERIETVGGRIFNIGGGPENTLSLLELLEFMRSKLGADVPVSFGDWRPGDQKVYVSDIARAEAELGWKPLVSVPEGLEKLDGWIRGNLELFAAREKECS